MVRRRVDPAARRLSERLDRASEIIPVIRAHLDGQRGHLSVLRVAGGDTRPGTSHADPVARLVLELARIDYREGLIDDALASIRVGVNLLDEACRDALGHRAPAAAGEPRCAGGDPSTWGDPTCGDLVESATRQYGTWYHPSGLCPKHRRRMERWQREQERTVDTLDKPRPR